MPQCHTSKALIVVEVTGIEPVTSSMPCSRSLSRKQYLRSCTSSLSARLVRGERRKLKTLRAEIEVNRADARLSWRQLPECAHLSPLRDSPGAALPAAP